MDSFAMFFGGILLIIALIFAYVVWQLWGGANHTINDDIARADEENVEDARETRRMMQILLPIVIAMFVLAILMLTGVYRYFNMVGVGVTAGGVLFTYIGIIIRTSASRKNVRCTSRCTGRVTDHVEQEDSEGHISYHPVYSYTVNGNEYEFTSNYGGGERAIPPIGESIEIFYDPVMPKVAYSSFDRKSGTTLVRWFLAFGIPMTLIGLGILIWNSHLLMMIRAWIYVHMM